MLKMVKIDYQLINYQLTNIVDQSINHPTITLKANLAVETPAMLRPLRFQA